MPQRSQSLKRQPTSYSAGFPKDIFYLRQRDDQEAKVPLRPYKPLCTTASETYTFPPSGSLAYHPVWSGRGRSTGYVGRVADLHIRLCQKNEVS
jgi:hypothetical protein